MDFRAFFPAFYSHGAWTNPSPWSIDVFFMVGDGKISFEAENFKQDSLVLVEWGYDRTIRPTKLCVLS